MNLNDNKFFNSTDIHVSSRMNEYLKKNFGYEVDGDMTTLEEAKQSLQLEQVELKKDSYMSKKYMENMLMIETITSLLKAHGEDTSSSYTHEEVTEELDLPETGDTTTSDASPETEQVEEDEEEKGPDHYRWKNDSQLSVAKDKLNQLMTELAIAINYREENSRNLMYNGDRAGTGDLQEMLDTLRKMHYDWEDTTQYYGM
tara:strand:+ start:3328 stop:3930 length:603 start_codon:yes stop_codon:yes gene_type:complete